MAISTSLTISGGLAIIIGILILGWPKFLRFGLGIWLILNGILQFISF